MNKKYDTLYHMDENNNVRVWWMEQEGDKYRTISGIENGNLMTSSWKKVEGKNIGKKNERSAEAQATAEVEALYTKKLERKYSVTKKNATKSNIIEPMLAKTYKGWDSSWQQVWSQPKLDGMRCIVTKEGMFSRQGKPIISCPHIAEALLGVFKKYPTAILDGELYNHDLHDDFNELMSIAKQTKPTIEDIEKSVKMIQYHIYDIVDNDEFNVRRNKLNTMLFSLTNTNYDHIHLVETFNVDKENDLDYYYAEYQERGYEGQMVRLGGTKYEHKRSKSLLKRKDFLDDEFKIVNIVEGAGNWSGYAKSVKCETKEGKIFFSGIKGSQTFTRELLNRKKAPKTVTIRYQNLTPDGIPRFPVAVAFYDEERDV